MLSAALWKAGGWLGAKRLAGRLKYADTSGGKKDGGRSVSEVAAKDDFWNNVTRDDQLSAHRVPAQLMGIIPNNTGGLGDVEKAATVFAYNEIEPIQECMKELNDFLGVEVIRFKPYLVGN